MIEYNLLRLFVLFLSLTAASSLSAKIWINELMQSNIDELFDDLYEFPDSWLELYNDDEVSSVDLKDWIISEKSNPAQGWKIPEDLTIEPLGYVILYFDKADTGLHANFRIDSGKTSLYLFNTSQDLEDCVIDIPKQPAPGIARGRIEDGSQDWSYFIRSNPGTTNDIENNTSTTLAPTPVFSHPGGIYKTRFPLLITLPENTPEEITANHIHYTTDGSEPTENSPVYSPFVLSFHPSSDQYKVNAFAIRAKVIAPGYLINRSTTNTYIMTGRDLELPVVSINLNQEYLFDPNFGIYVDGNGQYGITGNCQNYPRNYNQNWRKPMNIEYFPDSQTGSVINQLGELRVAGGCTRGNPQKTLVLYANKRFGEKRYDYQLFHQKPNQDIESFMLRNSGNDFWQTHFRDAAIQLFMGGKVDVDYQAYQPAILFINGDYYGIENLRERSEDDFIIANYNGLEDIDMIEITASNGDEIKAGDNVDYLYMEDFLRTHPSDQVSYEELASFVDIPAYMNYNILQMYVVNTDYPHNNSVIWKPRTPGGKWRYIVKDTDFGLGHNGASPDYNSFAWHFVGAEKARLLRRLLDKPEFREPFIDRFAIYMGDILSAETTTAIIDSLKQNIAPEVEYHRRRYGMGSLSDWHAEVDRMKDWAVARNINVYSSMTSYFGLRVAVPMFLEIASNVTGTEAITINDIRLQKPAFNGRFFRERPLHIRWEGTEESNIIGWRIKEIIGRAGENTYEILAKEFDYLIPSNCISVYFTAIAAPEDPEDPKDPEDPEETAIEETPPSSPIYIYTTGNQIRILGIQEPTTISLFDLSGRLLEEVVTNDTLVHLFAKQKGVFLIRISSHSETFSRKVVL